MLKGGRFEQSMNKKGAFAMANAKDAGLLHWFADQDQLTQEEILADMAMLMRRISNDRRRAGQALTNTDRLNSLARAIKSSRRIEFDRLSAREDLGDIERRRAERDARRRNNKSHPGDGRKFLVENLKLLAQLRVAQKMTFRQIQSHLKTNYKQDISLGLIHAVYGEISGMPDDK
jgi:hypothetical protein